MLRWQVLSWGCSRHFPSIRSRMGCWPVRGAGAWEARPPGLESVLARAGGLPVPECAQGQVWGPPGLAHARVWAGARLVLD